MVNVKYVFDPSEEVDGFSQPVYEIRISPDLARQLYDRLYHCGGDLALICDAIAKAAF